MGPQKPEQNLLQTAVVGGHAGSMASGTSAGSSRVASCRDSGQKQPPPQSTDPASRAASGPPMGLDFHSFLLLVYFAFQINFLMFLINLELN